jgi:DNA primase
MARISDDSKERVRDAVDMIDLVGTRTELKRAGANRYQGLCPFHDERTPSFGIDPLNKLYHCFGCGKGGDCFTFVEEAEGMRFPEALQFLADRYGVELELEAEDPEEAVRRAHRERLMELLERTATFYVRHLWDSQEAAGARKYLADRGLDEGTLREFRVGYAPSAWDTVLLASRRAKFSNEEIAASGLAVRGQQGKIYDRFRRRITFPLCDARGRVLGFGARALGADQQPKYLNSPEGDVYHKGRQLFAVDIARAAAAKSQTVIIAEGYTDVLALHQAGLKNTVGLMGTAMTPEQVAELARLAPTVLLALDADSAGQEAMIRAERLARARKLAVRVVSLPAGADPADLVQQQGAEAVAKLVEDSIPFVRFRVETVLATADTSSAEGKDIAIDELRPAFAPEALPPSALREALLKEVADRLDLVPSLVSSWLASGAPQRAPQRSQPSGDNGHVAAPVPPSREHAHERSFLAFCIALPDAGEEFLRKVEPERDLSTPLLRRAHSHLIGHLRSPGEGMAADDDELRALIAELAVTGQRETVSPALLEAEFIQLGLARTERELALAPPAEMKELAGRRQKLQGELKKAMGRAMEASSAADLET